MRFGIATMRRTPLEQLHAIAPAIDLLVPFFAEQLLPLQAAFPQLQFKGHTLVSGNAVNNFYLRPPHQSRVQSLTTLEVEAYVQRDLLAQLERDQGVAHQYEILNEIINDAARPRRTPWSGEFYAQLVNAVRQFNPELCLYYSDYNYLNRAKAQTILKLVNDLGLDGVCIQLHWSILSTQIWRYLATGYLQSLVRHLKETGYRVDFSEVGIRLQCPNIFALQNWPMPRNRRSILRDQLHQTLLAGLPLSYRRWQQRQLYTLLLQSAQQWGVDNFYCWGTDHSFPSADEPSLFDQQGRYKLGLSPVQAAPSEWMSPASLVSAVIPHSLSQ